MRVSRIKAAENRERVIAAAGLLFREKGFGGVSVADVMKAADLTHGGFYGQFESKDDLVAEACRQAMAAASVTWEKVVTGGAGGTGDAFAALLSHYLSLRHRDDPGHGCVFAALSADAARSGAVVRDAFADGLEPLIEILARVAPGRNRAARRRKAVAAMAGLVGAVLLSRAIGKGELSDEILEATRRELLAA